MKKGSLVFFAIVLLLSACSGQNEIVKPTGQEKIVLEFFTPKVETELIFNQLIEEFEDKHANIDVRQVVVPGGMTVLKTRLARGDAPDLFITYPIEQDYLIRAKKDYLMDVTDEAFISRIEPNIQNRYMVDNRMYGVALTQNVVGVLYNKGHFNELDLTIPEKWSEWLTVMEKLDRSGYTPLLMPNKDIEQTSVFTLNLVANQFPEDYWNQENYSIINNQDWIQISKKILSLLPYTQRNSFEDGYYEINEKFAKGEGTMFVMGTWALPLIEKINPNLEYGIFPFPADESDSHPVLGGVDIGLAISADTKHPEEAKAFLSFLTEKEQAERLSNYEGSISTVEGVDAARTEIKVLHEKILSNQAVNWPNHYWDGGTAAEADYRKYTSQFLIEQDIEAYLKNLENMFHQY